MSAWVYAWVVIVCASAGVAMLYWLAHQIVLAVIDARRDHVIDDEIAARGARPRPGMETVDRQKLNKLGSQLWQATKRAQVRSDQGGGSPMPKKTARPVPRLVRRVG